MMWKDLSNEAKSVIEWVENPYTNRKEIIIIEIGDHFIKENLPVYHGEHDKVDIFITEELYNEILEYVTHDDNIDCALSKNRLIFKLKDDVKLH